MTDNIQEIQRIRNEFLIRLHSKTGGNEGAHVNLWKLGEEVGINRADVNRIFEYLLAEELITVIRLQGDIGITHAGIIKVESLLLQQKEPISNMPSLKIESYNQSGGITAENVTIEGDRLKMKNKSDDNWRIFRIIGGILVGLSTIIAAIIAVIQYFSK